MPPRLLRRLRRPGRAGGTERSTPSAATRTTRSRAGGCVASARSATTARCSTRRQRVTRRSSATARRAPARSSRAGTRRWRRRASGWRASSAASVRRRSSTRTTPARSRSSATGYAMRFSTAWGRPRSTPTRSATWPATSPWATCTARRRSGSTRAPATRACILVWGANPSASGPHQPTSTGSREAPGTVVVIDPIRTGTAAARRPAPAAVPRHRRGAGLRAAARPRPRRHGRPGVPRRPHDRLRRARAGCSPLHARVGASARPACRRRDIERAAQALRPGPVAAVARAGHAAPADRRQRDARLRAAARRHREPRPARRRVPVPERRRPRRGIDGDAYVARAPGRAGAAGRQPDGPGRRAWRIRARGGARLAGTSTSRRPAPRQRDCVPRCAREDLFTVAIDLFPTDTDRSRRRRAAGRDVPRVRRPRACRTSTSASPPRSKAGDPPGEALPNPEIFRRLAAAMGYTEPELFEPDDGGHRASWCAGTASARDFAGPARASGPVPYRRRADRASSRTACPARRAGAWRSRAPRPRRTAMPASRPARRSAARRRHAAAADPGVALAAERLVRERPQGPRAARLEKVAVHPLDAANRGLAAGDRVRVTSDEGGLSSSWRSATAPARRRADPQGPLAQARAGRRERERADDGTAQRHGSRPPSTARWCASRPCPRQRPSAPTAPVPPAPLTFVRIAYSDVARS